MNLVRFIAKRYLFSKKNTNAINIISAISVLIFTVGTAVMIIILSFLNGLEGLVKGMDDAFDPDIKIEAKFAKIELRKPLSKNWNRALKTLNPKTELWKP